MSSTLCRANACPSKPKQARSYGTAFELELQLACIGLPCFVFLCLALPCLALLCLGLPGFTLPCLASPCLALLYSCAFRSIATQVHPWWFTWWFSPLPCKFFTWVKRVYMAEAPSRQVNGVWASLHGGGGYLHGASRFFTWGKSYHPCKQGLAGEREFSPM